MLHEIVTLIHLADKNRKITAPLGGHMWNCVACGQAQPHELVTVMKDESGPFAQTKKWGRELWWQSACEVCKHVTIHPHGINLKIIELWNKNSDLHDFAKRSEYGALPSNHRLITTQSAGALLKSIKSTSPILTLLLWTDYLLAVIIFIVGCFVGLVSCAKYLHHETLPSWLSFYPLGGFILGLLYLWIVLFFRKAGTHHRQMFEDRINHLGVSRETILNNAPKELLKINKIYQLLNPKRK